MEENDKSDQKMYYRMLGGTGLQVSVLSFGFWPADHTGIVAFTAFQKKCSQNKLSVIPFMGHV